MDRERGEPARRGDLGLPREGGKVMVCGRDEKQLELVRADLSEYGQVGVGWADPGKERAEPLTLRPR